MNKRFILSVALALFLGLAKLEDPAPPQEETQQNDFLAKNAALVKPWDPAEGSFSYTCILYDDLTYFDLSPLVGPYAFETLVDGVNKTIEVRFCSPTKREATSDGKALAFFVDQENNRVARLTGGNARMNYTETLRDQEGDKNGIFYRAKPNSEAGEQCIEANG